MNLDYKIIKSSSTEELEKKVKEAFKDGYLCISPPFVWNDLLLQPMTKTLTVATEEAK